MGTWRLLLAWLVIADHTPGVHLVTDVQIGKVAVCAFFFVSGFLMPLTYASHYQRYGLRSGAQRFYLNRFLRIYPIYWAALILTLFAVAAYGVTFLEHSTGVGPSGGLLAFLQNALLLGLNQTQIWGGDFRFDPPAWTLDIELQYYALVPALMLLTARSRIWAAAALAVLSAVSLYLFFRPTGSYPLDRSLLSWSFLFFLGYGFYFSPTLQAVAQRRLWIVLAAGLLLAAAHFSTHQNVTTLLVTLGCIAVSAHLLVLQEQRRFGAWDRLLGDLSYPTYILHWLCVELLLRWLGVNTLSATTKLRFVSLLLANITLTTIVAYLSLRLIGDPVESVRRKIRDARSPRHHQPAGAAAGGGAPPAEQRENSPR
jgi:peptidoglycan/LPS O-acetylase OafA/YrhL